MNCYKYLADKNLTIYVFMREAERGEKGERGREQILSINAIICGAR